MSARRAVGADLPRVVGILTAAFDDDPLWSWVFDDDAARRTDLGRLWALSVDGAQRYGTVWTTLGGEAAAVWIPPGGTELSPEQEVELDTFTASLPARQRERARLAFESLDAHHPHDRPHHYLSLLGTDPAQRGHGHGMALLDDTLAAIDVEHAHAYLESSNPANLERYGSRGFEAVDAIEFPDGPVVTTMWRDAR